MGEALRRDIRLDHWGYSKEKFATAEDLIRMKYSGIRPAPGYPSQPDHTEKRTMWDLMQIKEKAGIDLSESLAMLPASAVSALVFAHEDSKYFAVGEIAKDQVEEYGARKGDKLETTERWLRPILSYDA